MGKITPGMRGPDLIHVFVLDVIHNSFREVSEVSGEAVPGGHFRVFDRRSQKAIVKRDLGTIRPGKIRKRRANARRKERAVCRRGAPDVVGSFSYRSADPENERYPVWGGGVRSRRYVAAFSGFTEHADELLVCVVLFRLNIIDTEEVRSIFEVSNNTLGKETFQRFFAYHAKDRRPS